MADEAARVDPGIQRLLEAVGKAALYRRWITLGDDFYEATPEKERFIWCILGDQELFPDDKAKRCLVLRFGMSGHREHTPSECAEHQKLAPYTPHEVNQQIDQSLRKLASCLVLGYALAHKPMNAVTLEYLQVSGRTLNVLKRAGFVSVWQVSSMPDADLLGNEAKKGVRGFGRKSLEEVDRVLEYAERALEARVF